MSDFLPTGGGTLQSLVQAGLTQELITALANSGTVTDLPDSLQDASGPVVLNGTVASQTQDQAVVKTAAGPVNVTLDNQALLPRGTLTLVLQPGDGTQPPRVSFLTQAPAQMAPAPQAPPQQAQTPAAASSSGALPSGSPQPLTTTPGATGMATPASLSPGQTIQATLLPAATAPSALPVPETQEFAMALFSGAALPGPALAAGTLPAPASSMATGQTAVPGPTPAPPLGVTPPPSTPQQETQQDLGQQGSQDQGQYSGQQQPGQSPAALLQEALSTGFTANPVPASASGVPQDTAEEDDPSLPAGQDVRPGAAPPAQQPMPQAGIQSSFAQALPPASASFTVLSAQSPSGALPAGAFTATVIANTSSGQALLATPAGVMLTSVPVATPVGTAVTLQRVDTPPGLPAGAAPSASLPPIPLVLTPLSAGGPATWPALAQTLEHLEASDPLGAAALRAIIPQLAQGLAGSLAKYATPGGPLILPTSGGGAHASSAASSINSASINSAALRGALTQATVDLATTARASGGSVFAGGWHAYPVPLATDQGLSLLQIFVQTGAPSPDDDDPTVDGKGRANTRFIVEVSPSELGPVQLDGLLRQDRGHAGRLDLVLRTGFAIDPDDALAMEAAYHGALGATGMAGTLRLHGGATKFVTPHLAAAGPGFSTSA